MQQIPTADELTCSMTKRGDAVNRLKVRINHHPVSYEGIGLITAVILSLIGPFIIFPTHSVGALIALFVLLILIPTVSGFLSAINGFLSADNEKLHFRYVKYEKDIFYNDITEISYGTYTKYAGRFSKIRIALKIKTADGEEHTFNDKIDTEQMASSFDINSSCNVPIIRMYRFLSERLPDRAKGFVKMEGIMGMV